jgi:hypothetical protein
VITKLAALLSEGMRVVNTINLEVRAHLSSCNAVMVAQGYLYWLDMLVTLLASTFGPSLGTSGTMVSREESLQSRLVMGRVMLVD